MIASPEMRNHPAADALLDVFATWLGYRLDTIGVCGCNNESFRRIANDLGVSVGELTGLVRSGPHSTSELPKMMELLNLKASDIRRVQPLVLEDMQNACGCERAEPVAVSL